MPRAVSVFISTRIASLPRTQLSTDIHTNDVLIRTRKSFVEFSK